MNTSEIKSKLQRSIDFLQTELNQIRTGRASPALIEDVAVNAYDSKMAVKELGSVSLLDSQTLLVSPWDKSLLTSIVKAISESKLNLNPNEDGQVIRVPIPPLTEERRVALVKVVAQKVEESKQSMRNIRQEAMKDIDRDFAEKMISEDEKFTGKEEVERIVKEFADNADEMCKNKKDDLMTV